MPSAEWAWARESSSSNAFIAASRAWAFASAGGAMPRPARTFADEKRRPLEDGVHVQFASDLRESPLDPLVLHGRRARDHPQRLHASELGDERLGHTVGEVFLCRIA